MSRFASYSLVVAMVFHLAGLEPVAARKIHLKKGSGTIKVCSTSRFRRQCADYSITWDRPKRLYRLDYGIATRNNTEVVRFNSYHPTITAAEDAVAFFKRALNNSGGKVISVVVRVQRQMKKGNTTYYFSELEALNIRPKI